ncbi:uncharacterized protein [Typha angustifolia]|uniref:uncharacterized protein n=1 Tax=Typha angustifolia TaxID=59011 RepID=UPI003C2AD137
MEKRVLVVCGVAGLLGFLSVIMGFSAEATRIKDSDVVLYLGVCVYPSSSAMGLGISAALMLLLAEIITAVGSGCCGCCCGTNDTSNKTLTIILSVISWIAFVISFVLLLFGAAENGPGNNTKTSCTILKPGIFATGAVFSLVAVALGIASVVTLGSPVTMRKTTGVQHGQGVAMGQPQFSHQGNPQPPPVYANPYHGQPQFSHQGNPQPPPVYANPYHGQPQFSHQGNPQPPPVYANPYHGQPQFAPQSNPPV